jgi:hypothetical protein
MADIVTGSVTGQLDTMDLTKEIIKNQYEAVMATKDARHDITASTAAANADLSKQVDAIDDTLTALIHGVSRDVVDNKAQINALGYQVRDGFVATAKDGEINALKTQIALAQQSTYLSDKIDAGNGKTQELINSLKYGDLNRGLIERNAELTEARYEGRHWRDRAEMSQFAAVNSQIQALHSQLSTQLATQGTVNFGSMSGNAGRNTSTNNVV